jgi:RNA:NAD 2'-phosphotransferase (TPT1/KptA family)
MQDKEHQKRTSKFLSLILRHAPDTIGLELDSQGWADVCQLLDRAARHGMKISIEELRTIVATSEKSAFRLAMTGASFVPARVIPCQQWNSVWRRRNRRPCFITGPRNDL